MPSEQSEQPDRTAEFIRLYAAYNRRIYGYVRALVHNATDVEEVFQNTCEVLWKKFAQFTPGSNFFAWSCSIARFEALEMRRRRGRESQLFSDEFYDVIADSAVELADEVGRVHEALADCFAKLSADRRKLVELRYASGGTPQSVADQLGRSASAVYSALRRVHDLLFRCIQRQMTGGADLGQEPHA